MTIMTTAGADFINILRAYFLYKSKAFLYLQFVFVIFHRKNIGAKAARKMLVKLTTARRVRPEELATLETDFSNLATVERTKRTITKNHLSDRLTSRKLLTSSLCDDFIFKITDTFVFAKIDIKKYTIVKQ
jgi:hypothetical protein